jgi:hypothetical protein
MKHIFSHRKMLVVAAGIFLSTHALMGQDMLKRVNNTTPVPGGSVPSGMEEGTVISHNSSTSNTTVNVPAFGIGILTPITRLHIHASTLNPGTDYGHERFLRCSVGDVGNGTSDFFEIDNATNADGQFLPMLWGHKTTYSGTEQAPTSKSSLMLMGSTDLTNDNIGNTIPIMWFDAREVQNANLFPVSDQLTSAGSSIINRPLFDWSNYGTSEMRMLANGYLGIGTTSPTEQLHTTGGVRFTGLTNITGTPTYILVQDNNGKVWRQNYSAGSGVTNSCATQNLLPKVGASSSSLVCSQIYDNGSQVGINTTSPQAFFHVNVASATSTEETGFRMTVNDASNDFFEIHNGTGADNHFMPIFWGHKESYNNFSTPDLYFLGSFLDDGNSVNTDQSSSETPVMRFDVRKYTSSSNGGVPDNANALAVANRPLFQWSNYGTNVMLMDANGDLGIGKTPGTYNTTDVSAMVSGSPATGDVKLDVNGITRTNSLVVISDMRYKKNISQLDNSLNKVLKLEGVSYNWRNDEFKDKGFDDTKQIGFIAQQVKDIVPEAVGKDENGYYNVNYLALIPVLTEAIKDQEKIIESQKEEINKIKDQLNLHNGGNSLFNDIRLYQNEPNPFDHSTVIRYDLPASVSSASIYVFDLQGKLLKSIPIEQKGSGSIEIKGSELTPGMYIYTLIADGKEIESKKMILTAEN